MPVLCDPSILTVRRGMDWISRLSQSELAHVYAPASLQSIAGVWNPLELDEWRPRSMFRYRDWVVLDHVDQLATVARSDAESSTARTGVVLADLLHGLDRGHVLVARRPRILELVLECGYRVFQVGRPFEDEWVDALSSFLDQEHVAALMRRIRIMVRRTAAHAHGADFEVLDRGLESFR